MSSSPSVRRDDLRLLGAVIDGKYEVEAQVGAGGFATVYRARHRVWDAPVALKFFGTLAAAVPEQRDELLEAFLQEGRLMSELSSKIAGIVQARDAGAHTAADGRWLPFVVLEWLEGRNLEEIIERDLAPAQIGPSPTELTEIFDGPARALAAMHAAGVVHRDLKPANFFALGGHLSADATIKVLDFGVAKVMQEAASGRALTGTTIRAFTPDYGAPEQFDRSYGATGPWTDVFALALVLVEILAGGRAPFGRGDHMQLAFASQDPSRRPTPRTLGVEVNDAVERVFARALAVFPDDRYPDIGTFWTALRLAVERGITAGDRAVTDSPGPYATSSASFPGPAGSGLGPAITSELAPRSPPHSPPRRWPVALGVAGVAGLTIAALLGLRSGAVREPLAAATTDATSEAQMDSGHVEAPSPDAGDACPEGMIFVPGGKMFMGSDAEHPALAAAHPVHQVELADYCLDRSEVTRAAFVACSDQGECRRAYKSPWWPHDDAATWNARLPAYATLCNGEHPERDDHPINCVSWSQAVDYCKWAGKRLPREVEWEFAARGSDGRIFPWGDDAPDQRHGNLCGPECTRWHEASAIPLSGSLHGIDDGFAGTAPVGRFPAGAGQHGHLDLVGNVFEWVDDRFEAYPGHPDPTSLQAEDPQRVIRGGAFNSFMPEFADPALRYGLAEGARSHGVGFRCAADPAGGPPEPATP